LFCSLPKIECKTAGKFSPPVRGDFAEQRDEKRKLMKSDAATENGLLSRFVFI
jgi:hypothetical protein